jgi:hypothetical protein
MNEDHKTIQKLRSKIHRARAAFCHDENDHKAAFRMLEILNEDDESEQPTKEQE